ncbi:MAG: hypothetical protein QF599_02840, partial [Planctomycetota bacterium]|nr:hypothetical protein [Planctomycetota bacterium]
LAAQGKAQLELTPEQRVGLRATALAITAERRQGLREIARSGVPVINALPAESAAPVLSAWLDARRA